MNPSIIVQEPNYLGADMRLSFQYKDLPFCPSSCANHRFVRLRFSKDFLPSQKRVADQTEWVQETCAFYQLPQDRHME